MPIKVIRKKQSAEHLNPRSYVYLTERIAVKEKTDEKVST